jgi:hypothetical protein
MNIMHVSSKNEYHACPATNREFLLEEQQIELVSKCTGS